MVPHGPLPCPSLERLGNCLQLLSPTQRAVFWAPGLVSELSSQEGGHPQRRVGGGHLASRAGGTAGSQCPVPSRAAGPEPPGQPRFHLVTRAGFSSGPTCPQGMAVHLRPRGGGRWEGRGESPGGSPAPPCSALSLSVPEWEAASTPSQAPTEPEGSHNSGVCPAFLLQMYIALISLHALIMVGFHFLHCFEEDWTSEYVPGLPSLLQQGRVTGPGVGSLSPSWC